MTGSEPIIPVILSGGSGTRLWPFSTREKPKQFLALTARESMFQLTALRAGDATRFGGPVIVANARHAGLIEEQLAAIGVAPHGVILEPCARNTAPAIALAALLCGEAPMLVMPSDHVIRDDAAFRDAIDRALPLVRDGWLVTFGITPSGPETGYGYIRLGEALADGVHRVDRFVEKPDRETAQAMLDAGGHAWNGGIFLFRGDVFLEELQRHAPAILDAARAAIAAAGRSGVRISPQEEAFAASPSDSIDYAVMEKADRVAVVPVDMGWSDVGSWDALYDLGDRDGDGNLLAAGTRVIDGRGLMVRSEGIRVSIAGVDDLIVIANGREVMILPRGQSQMVKRFAD